MNTLEGMIKDLNKSELVADDGETDICTTSGELITALKRLQHYEDLEEQGRMVILPEGMNFRKLLEILDGNNSSCPSEYNLINRCELSCFECWLAALKGVDE